MLESMIKIKIKEMESYPEYKQILSTETTPRAAAMKLLNLLLKI